MKPLKLSKLFSKSWLIMTNVINELKHDEIKITLEKNQYNINTDDFLEFYYDILITVVSDIIQKRLDDYYELVEALDEEYKHDTRIIGH